MSSAPRHWSGSAGAIEGVCRKERDRLNLPPAIPCSGQRDGRDLTPSIARPTKRPESNSQRDFEAPAQAVRSL